MLCMCASVSAIYGLSFLHSGLAVMCLGAVMCPPNGLDIFMVYSAAYVVCACNRIPRVYRITGGLRISVVLFIVCACNHTD